MNLSGPRVVPNRPGVSKSYPKKNNKSLSLKLGLPRVTIRGQINLSTKVSEVTHKKVSCTSSNGPPRGYCGALEVNLKTCAKGTKLRVYNVISVHGDALVYLLRAFGK